jgi:hypothetical protein
MLGALKEPIEFEVVGGGGDPLDLLGPALIAGTAVFAAWLAARTANNRQREQLDHDRDMRDREDIRDTLDGSSERAETCLRGLRGFSAAIQAARPKGSEEELDEADAEELRKEVLNAQGQAHGHLQEMIADLIRIGLRFPEEDPITECHMDLHDAYEEWYDAMAADWAGDSDDSKEDAVPQAEKAAAKAFEQFMLNCRAWFAGVSEGEEERP